MHVDPRLLAPRWWPTWLVVLALAVLGRVPRVFRLALGAALGRALERLMGRRRRVAAANLALCFPGHGERRRQRLLRAHFQELGMAVLETAAAWSMSGRGLDRITRVSGARHVDRALEAGRGAMLVCAHLTCLEMCMQIASRHVHAHAIYRRNKNPVLDRVILRGRGRQGARMFLREDMRTLLAALRDNELVWFSPDQDHGIAQGDFVAFFGQPAATVTTPARIAARTGAAVIPLLYRRLPGRAGYELRFLPPLADFPGGDLVAATRRLNRLMEQQVYLAPAQYLWVHRRFKTRPAGTAPVYDG